MARSRDSGKSQRPPDQIERLYVFSIVSTALLVLLIVVLAVLTNGLLRKQSRQIDALSARLEALEAAPPRSLRNEPSTAPPASAPPSTPRERGASTPPASEPAHAQAPAPPTTSAPAAPTLSEVDLQKRLAAIVETTPTGEYSLTNRAAAGTLLADALAVAERASWSGNAWLGLALLANLLDRDTEADLFARRAQQAGVSPAPYLTLAARRALDAGAGERALTFAQRLGDIGSGTVAALIAAEASLLMHDYASAERAVAQVRNPQQLTLGEALRLGEVYVALERWGQLRALLSMITSVPAELQSERDYLGAVLAIQDNQLVEALAVLDYQVEQHPESYKRLMWRGVTLLQAGQYDAARETFTQTERWPARPEAWYWRGVLELRDGQPDAAANYFNNALASVSTYAPAHEALAGMAINRDDLDGATASAMNAIQSDPYRPTAHFLLALALCKANNRDDAERALRATFALDRSWLSTAQQTPAIQQLFSAEELSSLADTADPADVLNAVPSADTPQ